VGYSNRHGGSGVKNVVNTVVTPGTGSVGLSGFGFALYARYYLDAARLVRNAGSTGRFNPVPYSLYCHSIESSLKAFIWVSQGLGTKEIKDKYGHHLAKLWRDAKASGLKNVSVKPTPSREHAIADAHIYHRYREFQYINVVKADTDFPSLPDITVLARLAERLDEIVYPLALSKA